MACPKRTSNRITSRPFSNPVEDQRNRNGDCGQIYLWSDNMEGNIAVETTMETISRRRSASLKETKKRKALFWQGGLLFQTRKKRLDTYLLNRLVRIALNWRQYLLLAWKEEASILRFRRYDLLSKIRRQLNYRKTKSSCSWTQSRMKSKRRIL